MTIDAQKLLEKGMKYQDWELIEEAQKLLAAQNGGSPPTDIVVPTPPPSPKSTAGILANMREDAVLERGKELKEQHEHPNGEFGMDIRSGEGNRDRGDGSGKNTRREPINTDRVGSFNYFEDDMSEMVQHTKAAIQESSSDGKTPYTNRTPGRRKPPIRLVEVTCIGSGDKECGKKFKVAPKHARIKDGECRFVCEKCIIGKGRINRM